MNELILKRPLCKRIKKYEILRFQISGFVLSDFVSKESMPLTYIRHCFALAFLETLCDKTFEHDFCLWQNNSENLLEVYFRREWSSEKHNQWLFSEEGLAKLCSNVTLRINKMPHYSVSVSVSPQTEPLSFVPSGNKILANTLSLEKKTLDDFWNAKRPAKDKKDDGSIYLLQQDRALSGYYSFFHFSQSFLTKFLKYLQKNKI